MGSLSLIQGVNAKADSDSRDKKCGDDQEDRDKGRGKKGSGRSNCGRDKISVSKSSLLSNETPGSKEEWVTMMENRNISRPKIKYTQDGKAAVSSGSDGYNDLSYVNHWADDGSVTIYCTPGSDGAVDYQRACTVYKPADGLVTDSDGNYRYLVELWGQAEHSSYTGYLCSEWDPSKLYQKIWASSDDCILHGRDPTTKKRVNDERLTVRYGVEIGGVGISGERIVRVNDGWFGADDWTPGDGGNYGVIWEGTERKANLLALVDIGTKYRITEDYMPIGWKRDLDVAPI